MWGNYYEKIASAYGNMLTESIKILLDKLGFTYKNINFEDYGEVHDFLYKNNLNIKIEQSYDRVPLFNDSGQQILSFDELQYELIHLEHYDLQGGYNYGCLRRESIKLTKFIHNNKIGWKIEKYLN